VAPVHPSRCLLLFAGCAVIALTACDGGDTAAPAAPSVSAQPSGDIGEARAAMGGPTVALADALLAAAAQVDAARHSQPRGAMARQAAAAVQASLQELRDAALAADAAARPLAGDDRIGRAADVVTDAASVGLVAADDGAAQAAALERLSTLDERLEGVVAVWTEPGSQSEQRAALATAAADADAVAVEAAAEPAVPEGCPALRDARVRWAQLVAERSRRLAELATSAGGSEFDARRAEFTDQPYGEDRLAADAADRGCWAERSRLAGAAAGIRNQVETLEALLQS